MRFTQQLEAEVLEALARAPDMHLRFQPEDYRPDGTIMVYRDNLAETLHRRLYKEVVGDIPRGMYLKKSCTVTRCVNPHHYRLEKASRARHATCPNGHPYTPENTLPTGRLRCRTCRDERLEKSRKTKRRKGVCVNGHPITGDNVYEYTDVSGRVHRRCRQCHLERVRKARTGKAETNGENK